MTNLINPSRQNYEPKQTDNREKDRSQEVELPIPEKKNDVITTGNSGEKPEKNTGQTGIKPELDETKEKPEKIEKKQTGFDVNNTAEAERKDKRGNENERLKRDDNAESKTEDANWQQDKMNEANNQMGSIQNIEKASKLHDTREDSILDRPKTETYEKNDGDNVGGKIKKDNYTHSSDEKKRDDNNRKNNPKTANRQ